MSSQKMFHYGNSGSPDNGQKLVVVQIVKATPPKTLVSSRDDKRM